jgi:hypothetical protein
MSSSLGRRSHGLSLLRNIMYFILDYYIRLTEYNILDKYNRFNAAVAAVVFSC